jgi:subtilase family serine protease
VLSDITQFRTYFSLPAIDLTTTLIPGSPNPGIQDSSGDLQEADLDLELSGAVARNASINFVNTSNAYNGAIGALQYAIDNNLAPIISISYGDCELDIGIRGSANVRSLGHASQRAGPDHLRRLGR